MSNTTDSSSINIGVDPSTQNIAKTLTKNGIINTNGLSLSKENSKIDENSNCEEDVLHQNTCTVCSCHNVDQDDDDDDDVNNVDDGTVHNCQCNKMLSTYTKLLKNVGKSFR